MFESSEVGARRRPKDPAGPAGPCRRTRNARVETPQPCTRPVWPPPDSDPNNETRAPGRAATQPQASRAGLAAAVDVALQ
eukprot:7202239-Prymnesium_polylepis.1